MLRENRPLAWLTASILFHRLSGSMLVVAIPLFVIDRYGLSWEAGLTLAARLIPNILFGVIVGHIVDKWEPRKVAWVTAVMNAVLLASVPLTQSLVQLQILMFTAGVVYMFGLPARMALRPLVIAKGDETPGNALLVTAERLSSIVGPLLVGVIIASVGVEVSFPIQGGLAMLAAASVWGLPARPLREPEQAEAEQKEKPGLKSELRKMLVTGPAVLVRAVAGDRMLRVLVLTAFTYVGAVALGEVFVVGLAKENFAGSPGANGWLVSAMGAGGVLGALLSAWLSRFRPGPLYFFGNVLEALAWLVLPFIGVLPLALVCMVAAGFLESVATVVYFAEVQKRLPNELTGRFYASFIPLTDVFGMLGSLSGPVLLAGAGVTGGALVIAALIAVPVLLCGVTLLRPGTIEMPLTESPEESADADR
ncbi:arabinose efflux permease family protein [Saccharomonospora glauca K62]|uniref:Arabinose efflux permease family protein n=1 Tax=Saccharomonospora glauca K62 TaxID=928724 RepID=I1CYP6_9PSEU|nr:arabinose efflux permease family protein [Saccharomonospora glauca K62]